MNQAVVDIIEVMLGTKPKKKTAFGELGFYSETNLGPYVRDLDQS